MDENSVTTMDVRKFCPEMSWSYFGIYTIETIMFGLLGIRNDKLWNAVEMLEFLDPG